MGSINFSLPLCLLDAFQVESGQVAKLPETLGLDFPDASLIGFSNYCPLDHMLKHGLHC